MITCVVALLLLALVAVNIAIVTALNVSSRRTRRLMSPEERMAQDEQIKAELQKY
jgi:hypothetical protein